uniref:Uncharacterized protein n=1 Tax=Anguilla anguilla TaxID=7936 RepID=A0A0E9U5C7_ANGAN
MPFRNHFMPFCHVTPFFNYANVRAVVCIINLNAEIFLKKPNLCLTFEHVRILVTEI